MKSTTTPPQTDHSKITEKSYLTEGEVARRLGMSEKWMQKCRYEGTGIPFYKMGGRIRYAIKDVLTWEAGCRFEPSA
ncbi:helix-turn-helix domain-containing protein [Halocynthiibacter namhaensis]|uniref:helix-turn-helix domain-containing protein n=1 Tax=Halocynthiibacter namhaensis TaxID=1290553 RepID=UPI00057923FE|nr:helix-turn-helix domain-containing protein [Halocynthiibacter namhaensis]